MGEFEKGDVFEVSIDRFSGNGNGIVELNQGGHLNVGRVKCEVGDRISVEYVGNYVAYCTEEENRGNSYNVAKRYGLFKNNSHTANISSDDSDLGKTDPDNKNKLLNNLR